MFDKAVGFFFFFFGDSLVNECPVISRATKRSTEAT